MNNTITERIEQSVSTIEVASEIANKFSDVSATTEFPTEKGLVKPIGQLQREAEDAISRIAHFIETAWLPETEYENRKIFFVNNGVAYTPITSPYESGLDFQSDIDAGKFAVLQGLTANDVKSAAFLDAGRIKGSLIKVESTISTYSGLSELQADELHLHQKIKLQSLKTPDEIGTDNLWPDGLGGDYVVVAANTGVDSGNGMFISIGDFQLKKITNDFSVIEQLKQSQVQVGEKVSTGHTTWRIAQDKPKSGIQLDSGLYAMPLNGVHVDDFGAVAYEWRDSVAPGNHIDSTASFNAALDTGATVIAGDGTYVCSEELLFFTAGQRFKGQGGGSLMLNFFAKKQGVSWQTRLLFRGTPQKYIKTRRQSRASVDDPQDKPMAVALNIEEEYVDVSGLFIDLECDYTNYDKDNLGADFDCGVFVGTRIGVRLNDIKVRGYFREASFYIDNTRLADPERNLQFSTPAGRTYPVGDSVQNGTDKFRAENIVACGGKKGMFHAGPKDGRPEYYYDEIAGALVLDSRGGYGTSDHLITQSFFGGPDHHSGYRRYDPPLNDEGTRLDPMKVDIDEAAGAYFYDSLPSRQSRRVKFDTCRFTTIEATRIFVGNGLEIIFDNPVTESLSGVVYNTQGDQLDQYDYTLHSFKDIACYKTDYQGSQTGAHKISFVQSGNTPNPHYFQKLVNQHDVGIVGVSPLNSEPDEFSAYWLNISDPESQSITITSKSFKPFYMIMVEAEWTGLDITDLSTAVIGAELGENPRIGDNGILRVDTDLSTGINFQPNDIVELYIEGQDSLFTRFKLMVNGELREYRDGELKTSGRIVASGMSSDSRF